MPHHSQPRSSALRRRNWCLVERDFVVQTRLSAKAPVLIGKDSKEKLRRATPLSSKELFEGLDAMPMRQTEMRKTP
jgi:Domain of unknown function (DUF4174)